MSCPPSDDPVPSWWHCLGKFRRCALVGKSMALKVGCENLMTPLWFPLTAHDESPPLPAPTSVPLLHFPDSVTPNKLIFLQVALVMALITTRQT